MNTVDSIITNFLRNKHFNGVTELCKIMKNYGSDKGLGHHNYTTLYSMLMNHLQQQHEVNIFELGIGTTSALPSSMGPDGHPGASLYGWSKWLPHAKVIGADIDRNILFSQNNIDTYYVDQRDKEAIRNLWNEEKIKHLMFDVILDDGLHEFTANDIFLKNSYQKLKANGLYIIEDILPLDVNMFISEIPKYLELFSYARLVIIPNPNNNIDNTLLILQK
jgi:hypothetical protein